MEVSWRCAEELLHSLFKYAGKTSQQSKRTEVTVGEGQSSRLLCRGFLRIILPKHVGVKQHERQSDNNAGKGCLNGLKPIVRAVEYRCHDNSYQVGGNHVPFQNDSTGSEMPNDSRPNAITKDKRNRSQHGLDHCTSNATL